VPESGKVMPIIMRMEAGFARSVRPQQAKHLARLDGKAQIATATLLS